MIFVDKYLVSTWKVVFFGALFLFFVIVVLPKMSKITTETIGVSDSPDTSFSLEKNEFFLMLDEYGEEGRLFYVKVRWTFDVVWPLVYGLFLVSSIAYFSKNIKHRGYLVLLPISAVGFDFLENIFATINMLIYDTTYDVLFFIFKISNILKWSVLSISFVVLVYTIIFRIVYKKNKTLLR